MSLALVTSLLVTNICLADTYRVVGGEDAPTGSWPDAAAVMFGDEQGCTGTLIASEVVLTAAHCAGGITHVVLNTVDFAAGGEHIAVAETIVAENWRTHYDVALLILEEQSTVEPRVIARGCALDEFLHDGAAVAIVGYGAINPAGTRYDTRLQQAITTVRDSDCSDIGLGCEQRVSPGGELVAGGDGVDSCYGDSGGPLYLLPESDDANRQLRMDYNLVAQDDEPERAYLVGITSRGVEVGSEDCSAGGIYVRPDAVIDWIESSAGVELPDPSCELGADDTGDSSALHPVTSCSHGPGGRGLPGIAALLLVLGIGSTLRRRL